jgi:ADP-sugar diphosphatase
MDSEQDIRDRIKSLIVLSDHITSCKQNHIDAFVPLQNWIHRFSHELYQDSLKQQEDQEDVHVDKIIITDVDMFGPKRIGFLKMNVVSSMKNPRYDSNNSNSPSRIALNGVSFLRGGSTALLIVINPATSQDRFQPQVILTTQPRVPIGSMAFDELPAGMIDGGDVKLKAAQELEEECGIKITRESELIDMMQEVGYNHEALYPSAGGCDESMNFYVYETTRTTEQLQEIQNTITGAENENESIHLKLVPLSLLWKATADFKAVVAAKLYEEVLKVRSSYE